jgi:predicted nucleic acid-binding protein
MKGTVILDTGPLVAYLLKREQAHNWAKRRFQDSHAPFLTCEAVLSEACFLLRAIPNGPRAVFQLVVRGVIDVEFCVGAHASKIEELISRYANVPMSMADACLVRMSEIVEHASVLTLDRDFLVYRKHGREVIPCIIPEME